MEVFVYATNSVLVRTLARVALIHRNNQRLSSHRSRHRKSSLTKFGFGFDIAALKLRPYINIISD